MIDFTGSTEKPAKPPVSKAKPEGKMKLPSIGPVVKKSMGHDKIFVSAKFPSGGTFRFSVSRSGETLTFSGSSDSKIAKAQQKTLAEMVKFLKDETNGQRIERIEARLQTAGSIRQLCAAYEGEKLPSVKFKPVTDL